MVVTKKKPAAKKKTTSPSTNSGVIVMNGPLPCKMTDGVLSQIIDQWNIEISEDRVQVFYNMSSARAAVRRTTKTVGDEELDDADFWFVRLTS